MIISDKQIMQLIAYSHLLLSMMVREDAPVKLIEEVSKTVDQIANQQSEELKEVD